MQLQPVPEALADLNYYERMVIQRARVFQTVIQLRPLNTTYKFGGVPALKGVAMNFPLTFETTNEYVKRTLPNFDEFDILINGLPTKQGKIWRALVSLPKVFKALKWLKANNCHYNDIVIDTNIDLQYYGFVHFRDKKSVNIDLSDYNDAPYLDLDNREPLLKHYTVCDLDKVNINTSVLYKYSCKRVETEPLYNNFVNLDHWCFTDIFPSGRGGMYDKREIIVKPAMHLRYLLNHRHGIARRNQQYLFSAVHNKDIRAAESGIFASINATKNSNLNAKTMVEKLNQKDRELEVDLTTTMAAVIGSKEYYNKAN
jgi:hypothetical protein